MMKGKEAFEKKERKYGFSPRLSSASRPRRRIDESIKSVESQNVEFKPAYDHSAAGRSNWRDEYLKVICFFANADGGRLIIGVDDKGKPIGVENAKKLLEDVPNKIKDILGIIPKVITESRKGKDTTCVKVVDIFGGDTSIMVEVEI